MMGWQHQLDHMQIICTSLQTDNHATYAITSPLSFYRQDALRVTEKQRQSTEGIVQEIAGFYLTEKVQKVC